MNSTDNHQTTVILAQAGIYVSESRFTSHGRTISKF